MDALETLVREALAAHAGEAPPPDALSWPPEPHRRQWPYVAIVAAAVAAVAVVLALVRDGGDDTRSQPAGPPPTFAPVPPGMNEVSYHGITLVVPDDVPYGPAAVCSPVGVHSFDPNAGALDCSAPPFGTGKEMRVDLKPYHGTSAELGGPLRPNSTEERDLPGPGVSVTVEALTHDEAQAVIDSIRVTPVDRNGCAATLPALDNAPANELLPGTPASASECYYTADGDSAFLLYSLAIDPGRVPRVVSAIQGLPDGPGVRDRLQRTLHFVFRYPDGSTRVIEEVGVIDPELTDGEHVVHDPDNAVAQAFD